MRRLSAIGEVGVMVIAQAQTGAYPWSTRPTEVRWQEDHDLTVAAIIANVGQAQAKPVQQP